ncbi:hypothetical protein EV356DRAFT_528591 [Viridothelium virens]|uniref:Increased loss of mitochondrial DNA protein 1 n=1 Tax=Viridothelium virens TaxID=1048519 RepID=A0A6A6HN74_VIRVR|nr:hypothetical protein EV356DRAFT_528591 [Viridothelium virens]
MALISSLVIIRALSVAHITLAFFFLTAPKLIAEQNLVVILGASMRLPQPSGFDSPSDATAFVAIILAFLGLSDFTAASIRDELALSYWSSQLPVRLFFLFFVTGYTYLFKRGPETFGEAIKHTSGPADGLKNSLVFTWGFMEVTTWFWIYTSMRDEIRQLSNRQAEKDRDKNA